MAFPRWIERIRSCWQRCEAQTMAEYAVILGVITPAIIVAYALFAGSVSNLLNNVRGLL